ncbi:MAG: ribonuclease E/G [Proteobacteria bacterium]|nr:ribonuclease E/G [Pseudomonadota bacterium]MBI3498825.1 ribonuclease E/G [Pseudomonadota bacterium]
MTGGLTLAVERGPGETRIAMLEDGLLVEIEHERLDRASQLGAVLVGRVIRVDAELGAAFIDVGGERPGFLQERAEDLPPEGQTAIVQVAQDARGEKGPTLTRQVGLSGRFHVLNPMRPEVMVSRRISGAERHRLRTMTEMALAETGLGALLRTAAAGQSEAALQRDRERLVARWRQAEERARTLKAPSVLLARASLAIAAMVEAGDRDRLPDEVLFDDADLLIEARAWAAEEEPDLVDRLQLRQGGNLFEALGIEAEIEAALEPQVMLPGGATLTIEETEALVAIDVDAKSGQMRDRLAIDLKAAVEIARQVRLRALGGLIVVDFLRLSERSDRDRVVATMMETVADDPMSVQVMGWTRSGLFELIRPRSGASLAGRLTERRRAVKSTETVGLEALRAIIRAAGANPGKRLSLSAAGEVVRWLEKEGRASREEAEVRLGGSFEREVAKDFRAEQFEVVAR